MTNVRKVTPRMQFKGILGLVFSKHVSSAISDVKYCDLHIFSKYASDSALAFIAAPLNGCKKGIAG